MIWKRLKYRARRTLGLTRAGRDLTVFPDDIFIVSYPRSGNTWARFLIGNLLNPDDPVTFANVESRIPEIYFFTDRQLRRLARPRVLKSHEYFDPRYGRTIYLVRDPRDVAVSLYKYSLKRRNIPDGYPIEEFIPRFIAGEFLIDWGNWREHVLSWRASRSEEDGFLLLKYEDLLADPQKQLARIASTLKISPAPARLARAVALSSAANMRSLEQKQSAAWQLTRDTRQDVPFVGEARSGNWQGKLPPSSVREIEQAWGVAMQELGYSLASGPRTIVPTIVAPTSDTTGTGSTPHPLSEAERQTILVDWNRTQVDYPRDIPLHRFVEEQVERTPEVVAVLSGEQQITYRELNQRANQLAHRLRKLGVEPDALVAVCAERSLEMVIALLGTLKAGGAYVPLDPEYPPDRLQTMLQDSNSPVVLTQAHLLDRVPDSTAEVICLDRDWPSLASESTANPQVEINGKNLAYCIYTSGSTGKPKGVANVHEAIVNRLLWMRDTYKITAADRILQKTPYSFDVSVWEFFLPLITGATLVLARPGGHKDPAYLVRLIQEQKITTLHFVPSMLALFLEADELERCSSVRQVFASGEALSLELQCRFFERLHAKLHNLYGPTEAAVDVTSWECDPSYSRPVVPIGKPVANTQAYILDANLQLVPVGVAGELHIGGIQLARGYLNRPDLTAEKFIPDPFRQIPNARLYKTGDLARYLPDGNIEFLGRIDDQIKLRGFRIELGEIEALLCECPGVRLAAVSLRQDSPGDQRLVAYLVPSGRDDLSLDAIRAHLKQKLPEFMLPSRFVVLREMPLTMSGKVDRRALPAPKNDRDDSHPIVEARTGLEAAILPIFRKVLGMESLGVKENFFELGGHSLTAARLLSEIKRATGRELPLSAMLHGATVESLASLMASGSAPSSNSLVTCVQRGEEGIIPIFAPVVPGVETLGYAALARHLSPQQPFYTLQARQPVPAPQPFTRAELENLAHDYIAAMGSVQPHGPYHFIAMCDDVLVCEEMILQLERSGQEVGFFAILDTWPLQNTMVPWKWKIDYYTTRLRHAGKLPASDWLRAGREVLDRRRERQSSPRSSTRPTWGQIYWPGPAFELPRFRAPVVLFKRPRQPFFYVADREMGWGLRSSAGVELHEINLDHDNLLREPHIKTIGEVLAARLQKARRPASTGDPLCNERLSS